MPCCKQPWKILFLSYVILINFGLQCNAIFNYVYFTYYTVDPLNYSNWRNILSLLILNSIIISLALLPFILYTNVVPIGNLGNDGRSLSYLMQVVAAYCYLIPQPFIDARQIFYEVLQPDQIWHTDLDILFGPDHRPSESTNIQPMTVAYFNFGFSLFLLSVQYSRVFWNFSRALTLAVFCIMVTFSIHVLVEYCLLSVMIKIAENPKINSPSMPLELNVFTIIFLPILANIILLFSFTTVFHYGIFQYGGDVVVHRNRIIRRQMVQSYTHGICSNQVDMVRPFSPCTSENRCSEISFEPVFSLSYLSYIIAICSIVVSAIIKSPVVYFSNKNLYSSTASTLTVVNMFISFLYLVSWLILWFALILQRICNYKIESNANSNPDQILLNGNILLNDNGHLQLDQMENPFLLHHETASQSNLSKQNMMTVDRSTTSYPFNQETDMPNENRYKQFNPNSAPTEKRVAGYPRNSSFNLNESIQLSILNNDLLNYTPTRTAMRYSLDNNLQEHDNSFKESNLSSGQLRSPEKYRSSHGHAKGRLEQMDFLYGVPDISGVCSSHWTERLAKSPVISGIVGGKARGYHRTESDSMHSHIGGVNIDQVGILDTLSNPSVASNGVKIGRVYEQQQHQYQ